MAPTSSPPKRPALPPPPPPGAPRQEHVLAHGIYFTPAVAAPSPVASGDGSGSGGGGSGGGDETRWWGGGRCGRGQPFIDRRPQVRRHSRRPAALPPVPPLSAPSPGRQPPSPPPSIQTPVCQDTRACRRPGGHNPRFPARSLRQKGPLDGTSSCLRVLAVCRPRRRCRVPPCWPTASRAAPRGKVRARHTRTCGQPHESYSARYRDRTTALRRPPPRVTGSAVCRSSMPCGVTPIPTSGAAAAVVALAAAAVVVAPATTAAARPTRWAPPPRRRRLLVPASPAHPFSAGRHRHHGRRRPRPWPGGRRLRSGQRAGGTPTASYPGLGD